jgi:hypothetical protein
MYPSTYTLTVPADDEVPLIAVCPSVIGLVMVKPELLDTPLIVTAFDDVLSVSPDAVAFADTVVPEVSDKPVTLQVPTDDVVVEPNSVAPLYSFIVVPAASTDVPEMVAIVVPVQYDPVIIGAKLVALTAADVTVTEAEALDRQFVPLIALAVITAPTVKVRPEAVQLVPLATVDPILVDPE